MNTMTIRKEHPTPGPFALGAALLALFATVLLLSAPRPAVAQDGLEVVRASVLVPQAVGAALTNAAPSSRAVTFAGPVRPDGWLVKNGFQLQRLNTTAYTPDLLRGGLTFGDSLGRCTHLACTISYAQAAEGRYLVRKVTTTPVTPAIPAHEAYFLPAERMSLRQMSEMGFADLLAFARDNAVQVGPDTVDPSPRAYQVLVFALDRLQPGDSWLVFAGDSQGFSWNRDGWAVAGISSAFAVNGPGQTVFRVFYAPGKDNALSGKILAAGAFSNHFLPPVPPGTTSVVAAAPAVQELKARYAAKAFPTMK